MRYFAKYTITTRVEVTGLLTRASWSTIGDSTTRGQEEPGTQCPRDGDHCHVSQAQIPLQSLLLPSKDIWAKVLVELVLLS